MVKGPLRACTDEGLGRFCAGDYITLTDSTKAEGLNVVNAACILAEEECLHPWSNLPVKPGEARTR